MCDKGAKLVCERDVQEAIGSYIYLGVFSCLLADILPTYGYARGGVGFGRHALPEPPSNPLAFSVDDALQFCRMNSFEISKAIHIFNFQEVQI